MTLASQLTESGGGKSVKGDTMHGSVMPKGDIEEQDDAGRADMEATGDDTDNNAKTAESQVQAHLHEMPEQELAIMDFASVEWGVFEKQMTNDFGEALFRKGFALIEENRKLIC